MLSQQDQAILRSYPEGAIETVRQTHELGVPTYLAVTTGGAVRMFATALRANDETKKTVQGFTTLGLLILKSAVDPQPLAKPLPPKSQSPKRTGTGRRVKRVR